MLDSVPDTLVQEVCAINEQDHANNLDFPVVMDKRTRSERNRMFFEKLQSVILKTS